MRSNRLNNIFKPTENLSRKDIAGYGHSKDQSFMHGIEEKSLADKFNSDAIEGWQELGFDLEKLKKADRRFHQFTGIKIFFSVIIGLLVVTIPLYYYINNKVQPQKKISTTVADTEDKKGLLKQDSIILDISEVYINEKIEQMNPAPTKKQLAPTTLKNEFKEISEFYDRFEVQPLPLKKIRLHKKINQLEIRQIAKEVYLHNLKLVDYREYRTDPGIKTRQLMLTGTPADNEDVHSEAFETEWKTADVPYTEYIDKTMSVIDGANYKKALMRLETVLETYPEDVNAHFYSGLCLFNLGEYDKALDHFARCTINDFQNFDEEAEWLRASCLDHLNRNAEADKIYRLIVLRKGFYAAQAKDRLK